MDAALAWTIFSNALWISGLAIVVASYGYHDWLARETKRRRRDLFRQRSWQVPWTAGMCLTSVGWGVSQASRGWESLIWLVPGGWFAWELIRLLVSHQHQPLDTAGRP